MPTLENLTAADVNKVVNNKSLARAQQYLALVHKPTRSGATLAAHVAGSRTYKVEIHVDASGIHAGCTCLYDWGGYCKHIGAVLLKWLQSPESFTEIPATTTAGPNGDFPIAVTPVDLPPPQQPKELPPWLRLAVEDIRQRDLKELAYWLDSVKMQDLRGIADKRSWPAKGIKKADILDQLIPMMTDPAEISEALRKLGDEHTWVFWAMALLGSDRALRDTDLERVIELWGRLTKYKQTSTYTGHLCDQGLAISGEVQQHNTDFVPDAVMRHCPPMPDRLLPTLPDLSSDQPARDLHLADALTFVQQVNQLILMVEQQTPPLRPPMPEPQLAKFYPALKGWDYDPHELVDLDPKKITFGQDPSLTVPPQARLLPDETMQSLETITRTPAKLDFMANLLVAARIFQPGSPLTVWPQVKEKFFKKDERTQRAALARTYFIMTEWSELWDVLRQQPDLQLRRSLIAGHRTKTQLNTDLMSFRYVVLRVLACLPNERWLRVADLVPLLQKIFFRFDQSRWVTGYYGYHSPYKPVWYLARGDSTEPLKPGDAADWQLAQWSFVRAMLTGPLHWLGLVDLLYDNDEPVEIRLHGLADLFWNRQQAPEIPHPRQRQDTTTTAAPAPEKAVVIDGDTITIDPGEVSAQAHNLFDNLARLDEVLPNKFVYVLSVQAVHAAFENGYTLEGLVADWERLLPVPLPDHIHQQLSGWWQGYGQARIYDNVTVIEFSDEYALAEMKAVTSLAEHIITEISPRLVLIAADAVEPLTAELEKAGYTPKQTNKV